MTSSIRRAVGRSALVVLLMLGIVAAVQARSVEPAAAVSTPTLEVFQPETLAINAETAPIRNSFIRATFVVAHPSDWSLYQWRYSRRTAVEDAGAKSFVAVDSARVRTTGIGNGNNYTLFEAEIPMSDFSNWGFSGTVRWIDLQARIDLRFRQGTSSTFVDLQNNNWTYQALTETDSGVDEPDTLYDIYDSSRNATIASGGQFRVHYVCDDNDPGTGSASICDHAYIRVRSMNGGVFTGSNFASINQMVCGSGVAASAPCEGTNSPGAFNADDGTERNFLITPDASWGRGRWVIEAKMCSQAQRGNIANCTTGGGWQYIGSYYNNDGQTAPTFDTPTFTGGGNTVGGVLRPNTGATVNYPVISADGQIIGWDDGNDGTVEAWNYAEGSTNGQPLLTTAQKTRSINTTAKSAGASCRIRTQVTDNGGLNAADPSRVTSAVIQGPDCRVNTPPVGAAQGPLNATKGTGLAISLANTDATDSDARTCEQVTGPAKGVITGFPSCSVTYTASANQYNSDSFTYRVLDDHNGVSATYTVSLAIVNRSATATGQSVSVDAGDPTAITLGGTDPDGDNPLTCTAPNPSPTKGTLTGTACARSYTSSAGTANNGVGGADSFGFTVADAGQLFAGSGTVGITIRNPDLSLTKTHTGRFNPGTGSGTYTLTVANTSNSIASGTTTIVDTLPAGMTYRSFAAGTSGFSCTGTPGVSTTITCTRASTVPKPFTGALTITVDVTEGAGSPISNSAVISNLYELSSTVANNTATDATSINHRPVANPQDIPADIDQTFNFNLTGSDADADALSYTIDAAPTHGQLSGSGSSRQYTPDGGYQGVDSFTFHVTDTNSLSSSTVTVRIFVGVSALVGTVTSQVTSAPLPGIEVRVLDNSDVNNPVLVATAVTNGSGVYDLAAQFPTQGAVPFGTYAVRFVDPANNFISEYYENAPTRTTATNVVLTSAASSRTVDAALVPGGRIQGTVRSTAPGNATLDGLQVRLYKIGSAGSSATTTATGGQYKFELLSAGTYQLWFRDISQTGYVSEWSDEQTSQANATSITMTVGQQRLMNEDLAPVAPPPPPDSGTISGTVRSSQVGNAPIAGIQVRLYKEPYTTSTAATTDPNGNYTFSGLAPGSYKLWYRVMTSGTFVSEYYDNAPDLASAAALTLTNTSVVADAQLTPPPPAANTQVGTVTGTVTQLDGITPIAGIQVRLYIDGQTAGSTAATTDGNGVYTFTSRPAGSYQVWFRDVTASLWFNEWNLDRASQGTADPVAVTVGGTTVVNASLVAR
ncbi:MAG: putative Ig protein [Acidimicrobiales bacterium]|nr:putative Ig protein [Acidimicrobiales bacterium]